MMDAAINAPVVERVAQATTEMSSVPPAHARALILAAVTCLGENSPTIEATAEELAKRANLTESEYEEAREALEFILALVDFGGRDGYPAGLTLHPDLGWRGDPAERSRVSDLYPSLMLL